MFATMPSTVMILACSIDGWKFQIFDATLEQALVRAFAGELHEPLVGVGPGQEDLDLDARARPRRRGAR